MSTTQERMFEAPTAPAGPAAAQGALLYVPGATEGTLQWKAETFVLVNWGGFEGSVTFHLNGGVTLISGASGTGKSTLLDAYLALMMPSDTQFNGASNDAAGRARSAEQRNLLSYLRGQTDTTTDVDGRERPKVLRGDKQATWGALAMTFVDDRGERFTALRVYHVPAKASSVAEMTMRMATFDGSLDPVALAPLASSLFAPAELRKAFPGLVTYERYSAFSDRLFTKLGVGAGGDGTKALRLLARIQAGHQIRTVDALYKDMVLEKPDTFDKADQALAHFDELEATYQEMRTERRKRDMLAPIGDKHAKLTTALEAIEQIDLYGLTLPGASPFERWRLGREERLVEAAIAANRTTNDQVADRRRAAKSLHDQRKSELVAAQEEHRNAGGGKLALLESQIDQATSTVTERQERLTRLAKQTAGLDLEFHDAVTFAGVQEQGRAFLEDYETLVEAVDDQVRGLDEQAWPLQGRLKDLKADVESLEGRRGRVDRYLDGLRQQVCRASGMGPSQLPFLAELIDVRTDQGRWRTAIESVLGGSARVLLVPADQLEHFSAAINSEHLRGILHFEGVPLHQQAVVDPDVDKVAGKLHFDEESPFIGWVKNHVSHPSVNALCVQDASGLRGSGRRVTLTGQQRNGSRGQHGRRDESNIIGFSNADALAEARSQIDAVKAQLDDLDARRKALIGRKGDLAGQRDAYRAVWAQVFTDIDIWSAEEQMHTLQAAHEAILAADNRLSQLKQRVDEVEEQTTTAQRAVWELDEHAKTLREEWGALEERKDRVVDRVIEIDTSSAVVLTDDQVATLEGHFAMAVAPADPDDLATFDEHVHRLRTLLESQLKAAIAMRDEMGRDLERTFTAYKEEFNDPNLGTAVASYPDYADILADIAAVGLPEREAAWRERLTQWSGEDLVPLAQAMTAAIEEIEERLVPINDILAALPFGARSERLRIKLRRHALDLVVKFRRDLRALSSGATRPVGENELERRFADIAAFMRRLRPKSDPRATGERDKLLDVRQHVSITAEQYDESGVVRGVHSHLAGKSGGETQELVAFIVGAALRFRLGDELRARPRFAPVFLDEGFIKADSEFAGRAVEAWKGLGFQLIISAPMDKFSALEPHIDAFISITKNVESGYAFVSHVRDAGALPAGTAVPR